MLPWLMGSCPRPPRSSSDSRPSTPDHGHFSACSFWKNPDWIRSAWCAKGSFSPQALRTAAPDMPMMSKAGDGKGTSLFRASPFFARSSSLSALLSNSYSKLTAKRAASSRAVRPSPSGSYSRKSVQQPQRGRRSYGLVQHVQRMALQRRRARKSATRSSHERHVPDPRTAEDFAQTAWSIETP